MLFFDGIWFELISIKEISVDQNYTLYNNLSPLIDSPDFRLSSWYIAFLSPHKNNFQTKQIYKQFNKTLKKSHKY